MCCVGDAVGNSGLQAWRLRPEQPVLRDTRMLWWSCDLNLGFLTSGLVLVPLTGLSAFWDSEVDFHYFADLRQAPVKQLVQGIPWWSSSLDSELPVQGARVSSSSGTRSHKQN